MKKVLIAALIIGLVFPAITVEAAKNGLEIGAEVPKFELPGTDGKTHALADHDGKIVVLQFCSQNCPYSRGADPDIAKFAKTLAEKDVVLYGIDADKETTVESIKAYNDKRDLEFVTLKDVDNVYADKLYAKQTPEFFVIDSEGNLAYHGAFDNRVAPEEAGDVNYVLNAVNALLAGEEVEEPEVRAWGCSIARAKRPNW